MKKKYAVWGAVAAALITLPAAVGLVVFRGDSSSSARRAGALVSAGGATSYQLQLLGSTVAEGKDAIEVDSFSWGPSSTTTIGSATGGAGAGKVSFNDLKVTKKIDRASPGLFKYLATATQYPTAILTLRRSGETKPYMTYTMKTVFVTKVSLSGVSPQVASEEITFVFGSVFMEAVDSTLVEKAGWNQVTNVAVAGP